MTDAKNRDTEQLIDRLLMEQGEYHPLAFLLQEGRLDYGDYDAWRNGEVRDLSEMLFGDPAQITKTLEQAATYLQRRGWESERLVYRCRGRSETAPLRFSQESRLDECFHLAYRKPKDQSQLDLFTDTSTTFLVSGITQALKMLNASDAREALHRLYEAAPDHLHLGELERLVEALESLESPVKDAQVELQRLLSETSGLAERHLDKASHHLLIPLWRRLSRALETQVFDPAYPQLHASYTSIMARDWPGVRQAVEREDGWRNEAVLLTRHARASTHLSDQAAALQSWFHLIWRFPKLSDDFQTYADHTLRSAWQVFLDLEPELPDEDFPAWLLVRIPSFALIAPEVEDGTLCPASYHTLLCLQRSILKEGVDSTAPQAMELRLKLKQQAPLLFQHFLGSGTV
jgi:hypothetical protein